MIGEGLGQPDREPQAAVHGAEQERAAVGGEVAAGEIGDDLPATEGFKVEWQLGTGCRGRGGGGAGHKVQ